MAECPSRFSCAYYIKNRPPQAWFIKRFTAHTSTRMIDAIYDRTNALDYAEDAGIVTVGQ